MICVGGTGYCRARGAPQNGRHSWVCCTTQPAGLTYKNIYFIFWLTKHAGLGDLLSALPTCGADFTLQLNSAYKPRAGLFQPIV